MSSDSTTASRAEWSDADFARVARRHWRVALVAYLVPISVATHWPRLGFEGGGTIDKFVHFIGFGVLAWLWMNAKPFGRAAIGWCIGAAWVYLDERTQALEILGRTFSFHDMLAGWVGVAVAGALYAIRRERSPAGTDARIDQDFAEDLAYASGAAWRAAALVTAAIIVLLGGIIVLKRWWSEGEVFVGTIVYALGYSGTVGIAIAAVGMQMYGDAHGARHRRRPLVRVPRESLPFWRMGFMVGAAAVVLLGFEGLIRLVFGAEPPEELRVDYDGFVVMREGILLAAAALGIAAGTTIGTRAAIAANPTLASRR
ncbi:MAG: VanZ like family [Planctomycetota bacterium]|jgi:hypothetical protein